MACVGQARKSSTFRVGSAASASSDGDVEANAGAAGAAGAAAAARSPSQKTQRSAALATMTGKRCPAPSRSAFSERAASSELRRASK